MKPEFSIITPSLNDLPYLRRCCASVADQTGVTVEHLVVDGGSSDGTLEWLREQHAVTPLLATDHGMYEALNAGLDRATGEWVGILNCDEQYLPGVLRLVASYGRDHPATGMITGDFLIVGPNGDFICHRREIIPRSLYVRVSYLYALTCAMFIRREGIAGRFDTRFKAAADEEFVLRQLPRLQVSHLAHYVASFVDRPGALSASAIGARETLELRHRNPAWVRLARPLLLAGRHLEKLLAGGYTVARDLSYDLYTGDHLQNRTRFSVARAPWRWRRR